MGYISLFFASKGATVTGIDSNPNQTSLLEGEYDVVFWFSVLHHIVFKYGLRETQSMTSRLLDVADVLFVELA